MMEKLTQIDDLNILQIKAEGTYDWTKFEKSDALILEEANDQFLWDFIRQLRSQQKRQLYLKPVFLGRSINSSSALHKLFDGHGDEGANLKAIVEKINLRTTKLSRETFREEATYKVAVIDDDKLFLTMFSKIVEDNPAFELEWAVQDINEALERLPHQQIDVFFVDVNLGHGSGLDLIEKIKSFSIPHVVIVSASKEHALKAIELEVSDYLVKPINRSRVDQMLARLVKNDGQSNGKVDRENQVLRKTLEFIYSRNLETYEPIPFLGAKLGYLYPMLSENIDNGSESTVLDILTHAENENYLEPRFFDSAYFCNKCSNSFLHYRESCPTCKSLQLQQEDLVHHFRCAYIGPVSDYKTHENSHELICPKCDKQLKHIGVDYDKPSLVYSCQACKNVFQEPNVMAKCIACGNDDRVEYLVGKQISSFSLTLRGEQVVKGLISLAKKEKEEQISSDEIYFYRFFFKEIERKSESDFESCLAFLEMKSIERIYEEIGHKRSKELQSELFELIRAELPLSTEINFGTPHQIWFIFPDKSLERTHAYLEKLKFRLKSILRDNMGVHVEIVSNVCPISTEKPPREQIAELKAIQYI